MPSIALPRASQVCSRSQDTIRVSRAPNPRQRCPPNRPPPARRSRRHRTPRPLPPWPRRLRPDRAHLRRPGAQADLGWPSRRLPDPAPEAAAAREAASFAPGPPGSGRPTIGGRSGGRGRRSAGTRGRPWRRCRSRCRGGREVRAGLRGRGGRRGRIPVGQRGRGGSRALDFCGDSMGLLWGSKGRRTPASARADGTERGAEPTRAGLSAGKTRQKAFR